MRLIFLPNINGYQFAEKGSQYITFDIPGGFLHSQRNSLVNHWIVDCPFVFPSEAKYQQFLDFYNEYADSGEWFDIILLIEPEIARYPLRNYKAQIIPNTFFLSVERGVYDVTIQIEAYLDEPPMFIASEKYPVSSVVWREDMNVSADILEGTLREVMLEYQTQLESMNVSADILEGTLRELLRLYDDGAIEEMTVAADILEGTLREVIKLYDDGAIEEMNVTADIIAGTLQSVLISYTRYPLEEMTVSADIIGGTLT